jgi:hypothetical protein
MGEGAKMGIAMLLEWPGETQEQYEQLMKVLALDANPPEGGLFHVCGPIQGGWRVLEVWESEETFWRFFNERLKPAVRQVGIPDMPDPQLYPVHATCVWLAEWDVSRSLVND